MIGNEEADSYAITIRGWKGTVVSVKEDSDPGFDDIEVKGEDGQKYSVLSTHFDLDQLDFDQPRSIRDVQVGDVLLDSGGDECTVATRTGDILVFTYVQDGNVKASSNFHINEIATRFTLKLEPSEVKEMTVAEISEKLGYQVRVIE